MTHLATPAAVTGQPLFVDATRLGFRDEQMALAYCLDAPELVVAGGVKAVIVQGTFEGTTPRTVAR